MAEAIILEISSGTQNVFARAARLLKDDEKVGLITFQAGEIVRAFMVKNYLDGQRLRVITGKLKGGFTTIRMPSPRTDSALVTQTIYAPIQEYGDNRKFKGGRKGIRAKWYFRDSIRNTRGHVERNTKRLLERFLGGN